MFGITFSFSPDLGRKLIQAIPPVQATKKIPLFQGIAELFLK
jgi:hypothetical protein